jgi:hypothetical protein
VFDDPWPEEPDDPYEDPGDPESRFDLTIPDDADVPVALHRAFWSLVAVFNVALFAVAVGTLLVAFRGRWDLGGSILVAGVVLLAYGVHQYRRYKAADFEIASDGG